MSEHRSSGNFPWACVGQATTVAANRQSLAARRRRRVVSIRRGIGTAGEPIEESRAEFLPSTLLGGRLRAAQRKLWAWVDLNVIDLGRQMHLSHLSPSDGLHGGRDFWANRHRWDLLRQGLPWPLSGSASACPTTQDWSCQAWPSALGDPAFMPVQPHTIGENTLHAPPPNTVAGGILRRRAYLASSPYP
jgi:hypothetical protein